MSKPDDWIYWETALQLLKQRAESKYPEPPTEMRTGIEASLWREGQDSFEIRSKASRLGALAIEVCVELGEYFAGRDRYGAEAERVKKRLQSVRDAYQRTGMEP